MPAAAEWRNQGGPPFRGLGRRCGIHREHALPLRDEPAWRYWHARALENLSRTEESRIIYADLSGHPGYYGILAAERLGLEPPYLSQTFAADLSLLRRFEDRPETARALALPQIGLWIEAARELNIMLRGADSATLYAAALFAKERGLPDRQISLAHGPPTMWTCPQIPAALPARNCRCCGPHRAVTGTALGCDPPESRFVSTLCRPPAPWGSCR